MQSEPHAWTEGSLGVRPKDLKRLQSIQNLFSEIIGVNTTTFVLPSRASHFSSVISLFSSSRITTSCSEFEDIAHRSSFHEKTLCVHQALDAWYHHKETMFSCSHLLCYAVGQIECEDASTGAMVIGPFFVGKRGDKEACLHVCKGRDIDVEDFTDRLQEIRVFSATRLQTILSFVRELSEYRMMSLKPLENPAVPRPLTY